VVQIPHLFHAPFIHDPVDLSIPGSFGGLGIFGISSHTSLSGVLFSLFRDLVE
jgi:hypothetical protein